jgi:hypothetical protein
MNDLDIKELCFNPFFVVPLRSASGWQVVATSNELQHTHRKTFATRPAAHRFASKILHALDHDRSLNLRFWSTVELT